MRTDELVRGARAGDPGSREALARAWTRPAYGIALSLTGRAVEAEDLAQEALLRAFRSLRSLRDPARFGPWLVRIVKNAARDRARRAPSVSLGDAAGSIPAREDGTSSEDETVSAWRRLPDDERLVVWLKVVDGMSVREVAQFLGASKSAVDRTFQRGLARLRGEVARC